MAKIEELNNYTVFHLRLVRYLYYAKQAGLGELSAGLGVEYFTMQSRIKRGHTPKLVTPIYMRTGHPGKQSGYKLSPAGRRLYKKMVELKIKVPG